jgi:enoyl-CoA hydratase
LGDKYYRVDHQQGITTVTLNRPPANALDLEFTQQLADLFESLELGSDSRALVLTGEGNCFCAGLDLKVLVSYDIPQQDQLIQAFNRMALALYGFRRPTLAAVNGHAIAGGFILTLLCDYRIGPVDVGTYGLTEGQVGVAFPVGALMPAIAELQPGAARRLMLGAETYSAESALTDRAFDELVAVDQVVARATEVATVWKERPATYGQIKHQIRARELDAMRMAVRHGDPLEGHWLSEDIAEQVQAVLQR